MTQNGSGNNATARPSVTIAGQLNGVPLLPMLAADRSLLILRRLAGEVFSKGDFDELST